MMRAGGGTGFAGGVPGDGAARWMTPDRLETWARGARAGDSVIYGQGADLPAEALVPARTLAEAGVVDLVRARRGAAWAFIAQRRSKPFPDAAPVARRATRAPTRAVERTLLRIIRRCARMQMPCPSNATLAAMTGLSGALSVSYRLRRLVAAGLIRVEQPDPRRPRIVTVTASGERTAG